MWTVFNRWDALGKGYMTTNDFFLTMLQEQRNMFSDSILDLLDIEEDDKLDFGQFVLLVVTFCLFESVEILKFCFFIFDKDKNGLISKKEFVKGMAEMGIPEDLVSGLGALFEEMDTDGDGSLNFRELNKHIRGGKTVSLAKELRDGAFGEIKVDAKNPTALRNPFEEEEPAAEEPQAKIKA